MGRNISHWVRNPGGAIAAMLDRLAGRAPGEPVIALSFTTSGTNHTVTPFITTSSGTAIWDMGDGTEITSNSFSHTYTDGLSTHDVKIIGGIVGAAIRSFDATGDEITSIDITQLTGLTGILVLTNNNITGSLTLPIAPNCTRFRINNNNNLTDLVNLSSFTGLTNSIDITSSSITTLDLPNAPNCTALSVQTSSNLTTLTGLSNLTGIASLFAFNCNLTGTIALPSAAACSNIRLRVNPLLTGLTNVIGCAACDNIEIDGCGINVTDINDSLIDLDTNGLSSGSYNSSGGTNAAPTGAGATSAANIVGKSWAVTTN